MSAHIWTAFRSWDPLVWVFLCVFSYVFNYGIFVVASGFDLNFLCISSYRIELKLFRSSNVNVIDECRMFFNFLLYLVKRLHEDESVLKTRF